MRGRPTLPYGANDPIASPQWAYHVLLNTALALPNSCRLYSLDYESTFQAPFIYRPNKRSTIHHIMLLLRASPKTALSRSFLEYSLAFNLGTAHEDFTDALAVLRTGAIDARFTCTEIDVPGRKMPSEVFSLGRSLDTDEQARAGNLFAKHHSLIDAHTTFVGTMMESYVFGLILRSGEFDILPKSSLGQFHTLDSDLKADIVAVHKRTKLRFVFSCRNWREPLYGRADHITELEDYANAFDALCIMVTSFMHPSGLVRLKRLGFESITLERQILYKQLPKCRCPKWQRSKCGCNEALLDRPHTERILRDLIPIFGPYATSHYLMLLSGDLTFPEPGEYDELVACHEAAFKIAVDASIERALTKPRYWRIWPLGMPSKPFSVPSQFKVHERYLTLSTALNQPSEAKVLIKSGNNYNSRAHTKVSPLLISCVQAWRSQEWPRPSS